MTSPSAQDNPARDQLLQLFIQANQKSLPAMAEHVMELIFQLGESRVTVQELTNTILKDYALTSKILQLVNSAYYSGGTPISTVSRAVTVVGLEAMRQLATAMALLDEFLKQGAEHAEITKHFSLSLVSATMSRLYCEEARPNLSTEEAYLCTLLHRLGALVVLVYLPDQYWRVAQLIRQGYSEDYASGLALNGMTFNQIGREVATYWNFPKRTVACMDPVPSCPVSGNCDAFLLLHNLVVYSNTLTSTFFNGTDLDFAELVLRFGPLLDLDRTQSMELLDRAIGICENFTPAINESLGKLQRQRDQRIVAN
ncbi:MAG: HDOD domain-containing protein [Thermodesulfobacteriota bacterium]